MHTSSPANRACPSASSVSSRSWAAAPRTRLAETCADQAGSALTRALEELRALPGDDPARWQWGRARQARAEHRPFSRVAPLASLFELRAPVGGDTHTVNVSRVNLRTFSPARQ